MYVQLPLLVIAYGVALAAAECAPLTLGAGPPVRDPDTANAFYASTTLQNIAMNDPPLIYGYGSCFGNMTAAIDGANYLGYSNLRHFDPNWCAAKCDITPGCLGINLYMQRNPMLAPGPSCPDPPSTTVYRCGLWGKSVSVIPTNKGQTRNKFQVVIANSQGWNRYTSLEPGTGLSGPWRWAISGGARIGYVQKYLNVTVEPSSDGKPTRASLCVHASAFPFLPPYTARCVTRRPLRVSDWASLNVTGRRHGCA